MHASDEVTMVLTRTECNHAYSTTCLWHRSYSPFALQSWNNGAVIVLLHMATPAVGTASLEQCTLIASRRIEALSGMLLYFLSPSSSHSVSLLQTAQLNLSSRPLVPINLLSPYCSYIRHYTHWNINYINCVSSICMALPQYCTYSLFIFSQISRKFLHL